MREQRIPFEDIQRREDERRLALVRRIRELEAQY